MWQLTVNGCTWIGRGGREGWGVGGGSMRDLGKTEKEARVGWVKRQIQIGVVVSVRSLIFC